jgi:alpha-galactosidase
VIALHKRHRPLLHTGDVVRFDTERAYLAHGVYAPDRSEALVSFAVITTALSLVPPPLRLPGLEPDATYHVEHVPLPGARLGPNRSEVAWFRDGLRASGRQLAGPGLQLPAMHPETAALVHLRRV